MLAGVAVMGLIMAGLPLAGLFGSGGDDGPDPDARERGTDPGEAEPDDRRDDARQDLLPDAVAPAPPEPPPEDDPPRQPVDYEFRFGPGDHRIQDFVPGTDTLTISTRSWDVRLAAGGGGDGGSLIEIALGREVAVLRFPGQATPPFADIFLRVAEDGADPVTVPLPDVLDPLDPDTPDVLPADPSTGPGLPPADPDAPDTAPDPLPDAAPLAPTDPDAPEDPPHTQRVGATL